MPYRWCLPFLVGCATAGGSQEITGDASVDPTIDAPGASDDGPEPPIDAPPCTPMTTQLLVNPAFDATPVGTGWVETPIDPAYPLVTDQDGIVEHTPANKAWLGGFELAGSTDQIFQQVVLPPGTTQLTLTGFYDVRSSDTGTVVRDTAALVLVKPDGTIIESIITMDNVQKKTAWTAINHTFTMIAGLAGQPVRLRMSSTSDATLPTSFYLDSLALTATHCP